MTTNTDMTVGPKGGAAANKPQTLKAMLADVDVKKRFEEILGKRAGAFMSNLLQVAQSNQKLQECSPASLIAASMKSAVLDLPIEPSLGFASLVPYDGQAGFQVQWKGFVQLALRTGKYRRINLARVYEGQLVKHDEFTGEVVLDAEKKKSDKVQGYFFFFELTNGYRCEAYWSARRCMAHGKKFSKAFFSGPWTDDQALPRDEKTKRVDLDKWGGFLTADTGSDAMSAKTIVKMTLSKWGILSVEMLEAVKVDQATFDENGHTQYPDAIPATAVHEAKTYSEPKEKAAAGGAALAGEAFEFKVKRAVKADLSGEECFALIDSDGKTKYFTDAEAFATLGKVAAESGTLLVGRRVVKKVGDVEINWLTALEPKIVAAA